MSDVIRLDAWSTPDDPIAPITRLIYLWMRRGIDEELVVDTARANVLGATSATGIPARIYDAWDYNREFRMPTQPRIWFPYTMPAVFVNAPIVPASAVRVHELPPDPERGLPGVSREEAGWYVMKEDGTRERVEPFFIFPGRGVVFIDPWPAPPTFTQIVQSYYRRHPLGPDATTDEMEGRQATLARVKQWDLERRAEEIAAEEKEQERKNAELVARRNQLQLMVEENRQRSTEPPPPAPEPPATDPPSEGPNQ